MSPPISRVRKVTGRGTGVVEDAAVERGLLVDIGKVVTHHERDLGAIEPDAGSPRFVEMRQVDEKPGVEMQRDLDAVQRYRRRLADRGIGLLAGKPHPHIGFDRLLDVLARADEDLGVVAVGDDEIAGLDLGSGCP